MENLTIDILLKHLKEKKYFTIIKHVLDLLFVFYISSYVFIRCYFQYQLLDLDNYKLVVQFFLNGEFIIPTSIFLVIWITTYLISFYLFKFSNLILTRKFKEKINKLEIDIKNEIAKTSEGTLSTMGMSIRQRYGYEWYIQLYNIIKTQVSKEKWAEAVNAMNMHQQVLEYDFTVIFRGFLAVIIYFISVNYFGWIHFTILTITFISYTIHLTSAYQLIVFTPDIVYRIRSFVENVPSEK